MLLTAARTESTRLSEESQAEFARTSGPAPLGPSFRVVCGLGSRFWQTVVTYDLHGIRCNRLSEGALGLLPARRGVRVVIVLRETFRFLMFPQIITY